MTASFDYEKREFIRIPVAVPVRYKFLSKELSAQDMDTVHEGVTQNIGAGGILLRGKLPDSKWLSKLLTRRMYVGVNVILPSGDRPVKALCRVIWSSAIQQPTGQLMMGLEFQEITNQDRDRMTQYIIRAQMPN